MFTLVCLAGLSLNIGSSWLVFLIIWVLTCLIIRALLVFAGNQIALDMENLNTVSARIAKGDLRLVQGADVKDPVLSRVVSDLENISQLMTQAVTLVDQSSRQLVLSSSHVDSISLEISQANTKERETSEQVIQATEQLQNISKTVAEHVDKTMVTVGQARENALEGFTIVSQNINDLADTGTSVHKTAQEMVALKNIIGRIQSIAGTIRDIADQTNLLGLNARIESARAGEAGKGFAVVANEIVDLAGQTETETGGIGQVISQVIGQVDQSVDSMEQVVTKVKNSQDQFQTSVEAFGLIKEDVERTIENAEHIQAYNKDQADQLTLLHERLNALLEVFAVSIQKSASTSMVARDLVETSEKLNQMIDQFKLDPPKPPQRSDRELRREPRIKNHLKVSMYQDNRVVEGFTDNLSMTGLMVKCGEALDRDRDIRVVMQLPREIFNMEKDQLEMTAVVLRENQKNHDFYFGMQFVNMTASVHKDLSRVFEYFQKSVEYA
ncbi:MAG: methyl-accepting chemotaxis protein [Desulfobacter sp.]|nr:MAG: methyl-accepting chemotaxis protein [Desulfobacter sp.]